MTTHYENDSATPAYLREMLSMETEGERTPAQRQRFVNLGGVVLVTPETAEALSREAA